ncbi:hypothetical protein QWM81_02365 [Streptomyces ficellus]|uniref:Uncharacterized protein n=1 Tax=Streptomyces ficellus TaxID=1977088 RepID=A0ABT7Z087_9ACTN|nr:hypothetical protein [Streptomyces ficellus]MDN3292908.1 hypothetical protein [Streptomyces ficellus]
MSGSAQKSGQPAPEGSAVPIDRLELTGAGSRNGQKIGATVSCELMKNRLPGSPIEPTRDSLAVQDTGGNPMLFTVGTDGKLRLLRVAPGTASGWSLTDLTSGFDTHGEVTAFDAVQDSHGRITVALAMTRQGANGTDLFLAARLSDSSADWSGFRAKTTHVQGFDPAFRAQNIRMGSTEDGGTGDDAEQPFVTVIGTTGEASADDKEAVKSYYQVSRPGSDAVPLKFPETVTNPHGVLDVTVGYVHHRRVFWYLYPLGDGQTLEATAVDNPALTYDFSPGYDGGDRPVPSSWRYTAISAVSRRQRGRPVSDLYAAHNEGIVVFPNGGSTWQSVTDQVTDAHQVTVAEDSTGVAVWALCEQEKLVYVHGVRGDHGITWAPPITFSDRALHIAPIRNRQRCANEVFLVEGGTAGSGPAVTHLWQDPGSTLWQRRPLLTGRNGMIQQADTFTSHVHFQDAAGNPLVRQTVEVRASEWTYLTVNGVLHALGPHEPVPLPTDALGNLTFLSLAADIAPPVLHLTSEAFSGTLNVWPNGRVRKGLAAVTSGQDLRNARTAENKPVLDDQVDAKSVDAVADALRQLVQAAGTHAGPDGDALFSSVDTGTQDGTAPTHVDAIEPRALPADFALCLTVTDGRVRMGHDQDVYAADFWDDPIATLGDALHDFGRLCEQGWDVLKQGFRVVVKSVGQALSCVIDIAGKVFRVVLQTAAAVFKALNSVLKLVGIDLTKIIAWLGHLFGWDDIWATHKVLSRMMTSAADALATCVREDIEGWRAAIRRELGAVRESLTKAGEAGEAGGIQPRQQPGGAGDGVLAGITNVAACGFSVYQSLFGGLFDGDSGGQDRVFGTFTKEVGPALIKLAEGVVTGAAAEAAVLTRFLGDPDAAVATARSTAIGVAVGLLDDLEKVAEALLDLVEDVLTAVKEQLGKPVELPFLSDFYEFVSGLLGDEEKCTLANGLSLLIALPMVEIYRIAGQEPPFSQAGSAILTEEGSVAKAYAYATGRVAEAHTLTDAAAAGGAPMPYASAVAAATTASTPGGTAQEPASSESGYDNFVFEYARWGGAVAAFASAIGGLISIGSWLGKENDPEYKPGMMLTYGALGCGLLKQAGTVPFPKPGQDAAVTTLRGVAWCTALGSLLVKQFGMTNPVKGGGKAACDVTTLACLLVANGLAGEKNAAVWAADVLSNIGGATEGIGLAMEQPEVSAVGLVSGKLGGGGITFARSLTIKVPEVLSAINVGG